MAHLHFADTQNQTINANEPPSQRTTTDQMNGQVKSKQAERIANSQFGARASSR